ncbi:MAG: SdrD B-like domain-containing protein, partial [Saprospiraceae bacterium]|nr:SdrD B-like domain-containing protein [Saprospiraceae bacterium]
MRNSTPSCQIPWASAVHKSVTKNLPLTLIAFVLILLSAWTNELEAQCDCPTAIITNSGFESGTTGWSSSTEFYTGTGFQQCGTSLNGFLQATSTAGWVWQEVNAIPGADYFLTVYAGTHHPGGDHRVRLSFYNSSGNFIAADTKQVDFDVDGQGGDLGLYTMQLKAPSNAAKVRFEGYADSDYLKLDEVCLTVSEVMDYSYTCAENKTVTLHPLDNKGQSSSSITIPNSNEVFKYVVEIVYKGSYQPGNVLTIQGDGTDYYLNRVIVEGSSSNEKVWRGEINGNPSTISYTNNQSTNQLQSLLVYAFRNGGDGNDISGTFTAVSGYHQTEEFSIDIPTDNSARDIEVAIPLSEVTYDCRVLDITIQPKNNGSNTGSATEYRFVGDPNLWSPCCIEVIDVSLTGVPGNADEIFISIDSPTGSSSSCPDSGSSQNGQSYVIAGALTVKTECDDCDNVTDGGEIGFDQTICGTSGDPEMFQNVQSPTGGSGDLEIIWLRTNDNNLPVGDWEVINGATELTYDEGVIFEDMWYIRCARRAGCEEYVGESNIVYVNLTQPILSDVHPTDVTSCDSNNGTLNIDPNVSGGTVLPFTVEYTFEGQVFTAGPFNDVSTNLITGLAAGEYSNITLIDATGCTDTWPTAVTIGGVEIPIANAGGDQTICSGSNTTLCAIGGQSYQWSTGGITACISVNPTTTTTYSVTVTSPDGCTDTDQVTVNVESCNGCNNTLVEYGFGEPCNDPIDGFEPLNVEGECISATNLEPYNGASNASCNDGIICVASVYNGWELELTATGGFSVSSLSGNFLYPIDLGTAGGSSNDDDCPSTFDYLVKVYVNGGLVETFNGNLPADEFTLENIVFSDPIDAEFGDVIRVRIDGTTNDTHCDLFELGGFSVKGCCVTCSPEVEVTADPNPVCAGAAVTITATATNTTGTVTYNWSNGLSGGSTVVANPTETTVYSVTITDEEGCEDVGSVLVTVEDCCALSADAGADLTVCEGETVTFTATAINPSTCEINCTTITDSYDINVDAWEGSSGHICDDEFKSTSGSGYTDLGSFSDPINDSNKKIVSVTVTYNVAACDEESSTSSSDTDNVDFDFPFEINGHTLGVFDPTELPCVFDVCEPNGVVTFTVDPTTFPYNYGGTNTIDLNFLTGNQSICVANIDLHFETEETICDDSQEVSYEWSNGQTTQSISVSQGGTYIVTITDCGGCTATDEVSLILDGGPSVDVGPDIEICDGDQVHITSEVTNISTCGTPGTTDCDHNLVDQGGWLNNVNASQYCGDNAGTKLWTQSGEGTSYVTLDFGTVVPSGTSLCIAMKLEHCSNTGSNYSDAKIRGSLNATSGFYNLDNSLTFSNSSYVCFGFDITTPTRYIRIEDNGHCSFRVDYVQYTTPNTFEESVTYSWSGPGIVGPNDGESIVVDQSGTYTLVVTDCDGCTGSDEVVVSINDPVIADAGDDEIICSGESVTLNAATVSGGSYEWTDQQGNVISSSQSVTVSPLENATYILTVTKDGCEDSDDVEVIVKDKVIDPGVIMESQSNCGPFEPETLTGTPADVTGDNLNLSYQWESRTSGGTWSDINGANSINYSPGFVSETTEYRRIAFSGNGCGNKTTNVVTITVFNVPVLDAGQDVSICLGSQITLTVNASGGEEPYSYSWPFGLGNGNSKTVSPNTTTIYVVTVTDVNGCTDIDDVTVIVNPNPTAEGVDGEICAGDTDGSVSVNPSGGQAPYSYFWSNGGNSQTLNNLSPASTTTYTVTVVDNNECSSTASATLVVNPNPELDLGDDIELCEGNSVTIVANATSGTAPFTYTINGQNMPNGEVEVSPLVNTTYTVIATDAKGCFTSDEITVIVKDNPLAVITGPETICAKEDVQFLASNAGPGAIYEWTFENGTPLSANGSSVIVQWTNVGEYEITLKVTKDGCVSTATTTIIITQDVIAVAGPDQEICQGGNILLDGSGTPGGNYTWSVESGDITSIDNGQNSEDVLVSPLFTTVYKLVVTQNGCTRTDFVTVTIDVNKNPIADAGEDKAECEDEDFMLGGDPTGTPPVNDPTAELGYIWLPSTYLNDPTLANPTANIPDPGTYDYQVIVFSLGTGCADTSSVTITIEEKATVGDFTFIDTNFNGVQDAGEVGVNGIEVTLYDANTNNEVASTVSVSNGGEDGFYEFEVCKGDYYIIFGDLDNHERSPKDQTSDNLDSDANPLDGRTDDFTLLPGENNEDVDAGYATVADLNLIKTVNDDTPSVGDVVTFTITVSNDGPNNATNVEVTDLVPDGYTNIASVDGNVNGSTVTFSGLNIASGSSVDVTLTAEVLAPASPSTSYVNIAEITDSDQFDTDSTPNNGADTNGTGGIGSQDPDDTQDPDDEDDGDDAEVVPSGTISGNVSEDIDNDDIGDIGIPNVEITLVNEDTGDILTTFTDENGNYIFTDLNPGTYSVSEQPEDQIDPDYVDVFDGDETPEDG